MHVSYRVVVSSFIQPLVNDYDAKAGRARLFDDLGDAVEQRLSLQPVFLERRSFRRSYRRTAELVVQEGPRLAPVAMSRALRQSEHLRGFLERQTAKET